MVMGKLPVPRLTASLDNSRQGPVVFAVGAGAGGGGLDIFSLVHHFSLLSSPSLGDGRI